MWPRGPTRPRQLAKLQLAKLLRFSRATGVETTVWQVGPGPKRKSRTFRASHQCNQSSRFCGCVCIRRVCRLLQPSPIHTPPTQRYRARVTNWAQDYGWNTAHHGAAVPERDLDPKQASRAFKCRMKLDLRQAQGLCSGRSGAIAITIGQKCAVCRRASPWGRERREFKGMNVAAPADGRRAA